MRILGWILTVVIVTGAGAGHAEPHEICAQAAEQAAARHGIPDHLLSAVALVETGRYDAAKAATSAWPWTVTADGKGRYLPTKKAAIDTVKRLRARGVENIDVGCMQINLYFHPNAFDSLSAAFDPPTNAAYAADFMVRLYQESGSWTRAAAHYHSRTRRLAANYKAKVVTAWRGLARAAAIAGQSAPAEPAKERDDFGGDTDTRPVLAAQSPARAAAKRAAERWRQERLAAYYAEKASPGPSPGPM